MKVCWQLGMTKHLFWEPVVYGQLVGILPGEPCQPTRTALESMNVSCTRCREAKKVFDQKKFDIAAKAYGL